MSELLENTFHHVNIALVNDLDQHDFVIGVDIWQVVGAARSETLEFMPFYVGPGGGHSLPIKYIGFVDAGDIRSGRLQGRGTIQLAPISTPSVGARYTIGTEFRIVRTRFFAAPDSDDGIPRTLIHPLASSGGDTSLDKGCFAAGAQLTNSSRLGRRVNAHRNLTARHGHVIDDSTSNHPSATISSEVRLGGRLIIGTCEILRPGHRIRKGANVGAGPAVLQDASPAGDSSLHSRKSAHSTCTRARPGLAAIAKRGWHVAAPMEKR